MAATKIIGVDFSGAQNNDPWVAWADLCAGKLKLESCYPLPREELTERLFALCDKPNAVIGMDFPFGVPKAFAKAEFGYEGALMPEMWAAIAQRLNQSDYIAEIRPRLRKGDLQRFNKCMRQGDAAHFKTIALSPLNPAQPEMFPMTFYGMSMLHTLWANSDCRVPPLRSTYRKGAVLLETMPGAVLARFGFERRVYKNYKKRARRNVRKTILDELPTKSRKFGVEFDNLSGFSDLCIGVHDCLDAVVAAAIWAQNPDQFHHPKEGKELTAARREGWIYAPHPQP